MSNQEDQLWLIFVTKGLSPATIEPDLGSYIKIRRELENLKGYSDTPEHANFMEARQVDGDELNATKKLSSVVADRTPMRNITHLEGKMRFWLS